MPSSPVQSSPTSELALTEGSGGPDDRVAGDGTLEEGWQDDVRAAYADGASPDEIVAAFTAVRLTHDDVEYVLKLGIWEPGYDDRLVNLVLRKDDSGEVAA